MAAAPSSVVVVMIVPVTVIGSAVVGPCRVPFELVCANASGATSAQARVTIVFFMNASLLLLILDNTFPCRAQYFGESAPLGSTHWTNSTGGQGFRAFGALWAFGLRDFRAPNVN